jgi:hypothetical protein
MLSSAPQAISGATLLPMMDGGALSGQKHSNSKQRL